MLNLYSSADMSFLIVGALATWGFFLVFLGSYNLVSNIIKKHYIKGVIMEIDDRIDDCEVMLRDAQDNYDNGDLDMEFFIDDLWAELEDLKELKGVCDD